MNITIPQEMLKEELELSIVVRFHRVKAENQGNSGYSQHDVSNQDVSHVEPHITINGARVYWNGDNPAVAVDASSGSNANGHHHEKHNGKETSEDFKIQKHHDQGDSRKIKRFGDTADDGLDGSSNSCFSRLVKSFQTFCFDICRFYPGSPTVTSGDINLQRSLRKQENEHVETNEDSPEIQETHNFESVNYEPEIDKGGRSTDEVLESLDSSLSAEEDLSDPERNEQYLQKLLNIHSASLTRFPPATTTVERTTAVNSDGNFISDLLKRQRQMEVKLEKRAQEDRSMKSSIRCNHDPDGKFKCLAYTSGPNLMKKHLKVHTTLDPGAKKICGFCGARYRNKKDLRGHLKNHHGGFTRLEHNKYKLLEK